MRATILSRFVAGLALLAPGIACNGDSLTSTSVATTKGGITVVPRTAIIRAGQVVTLQARLIDEFGDPLDTSISWRSSNDAVATVAATGEVYGRGEGHAVITASALGKGQSATVQVLRREPKPGKNDPKAPLLLLRRVR